MHHICIIRVPEGEEKEKGTEKIFEELIAENFPKMGKEIKQVLILTLGDKKVYNNF